MYKTESETALKEFTILQTIKRNVAGWSACLIRAEWHDVVYNTNAILNTGNNS